MGTNPDFSNTPSVGIQSTTSSHFDLIHQGLSTLVHRHHRLPISTHRYLLQLGQEEANSSSDCSSC